MPREYDIYEQLLAKGYSKRDIHSVLHKCMLLEIEQRKKQSTAQTQNQASSKTSLFYKASHYLKNLSGKALYFLKTQFAKKPKNPV